ncbi:MAG: hypothetical protein MI974_00005 [Chitinophagales bacterium]|nr:hypothetical protein [Chitinophagales bacterium]
MKIKVFILSIIVAIAFSACQQEMPENYSIGQQSYEFVDEERQRPLLVEVWYPTHDTLTTVSSNAKEIFKKIQSIPDANISEGKFPLLIVSHGTGGNRFSLTWLIDKMVREGYIVVSLGHYGNTSFHKLPREFVKWWERAIDVQFVLDEVLANEGLKHHIDPSKIGGVGFSLGGYTNIALAGGIVDRTYHAGDDENKGRTLPPEFPETDEVIDFENDSLILDSYHKYGDKVKDDRIKAFFVMAPAVGFGFHSEKQTENIKAPIYIVAGKGDTNTPIEHNALNYHNLIATSDLHLFDEKVDHYVFLNEATEFGKTILPHITIDAEGVDRRQIHEQTTQLAINFFSKHLGKGE